ncbi:hypothetical protein [Xanthomonas sp. 3498]|uniref:hypothetical protein n=1 Tax=Xanthomonas sp. 3498 TaxID=2663863 RepID=UPI00161C0570|nr:hypothetical protein [Xanthomonas sp. 3498]MBB5875897.1 hypothetical protein [Xanthomonas sp. 3498]
MDVSKLLARLRRAASAIQFMPRRDTADMRRTFTDRAEMHRFFDAQHDAGYDCFVRPLDAPQQNDAGYEYFKQQPDRWEVRCYKRMK